MNGELSEDAFCTSREAARLLNISVKASQHWVENGVLHAWKTPGGHRGITRQSVQELCRNVVLGEIRAGGGLPDDVPVPTKAIPFNSLRDLVEKQLVNRVE